MIMAVVGYGIKQIPMGKVLPHEYPLGVCTMETKMCNKCGEKKLLNEFSKVCMAKDGRHGTCKNCINVVNRKYIKPIINFPNEIWKDITIDNGRYKGLYMASSYGRIKGVNKNIQYLNKNVFYPEKIMKSMLNKKGYLHVFLTHNVKYSCFRVHRIVAESFIPNPLDFPEVNHKNGIKIDNMVENLEWTTHKGNMVHAKINGLLSPRIGMLNGRSKLTRDQVIKIREEYLAGDKSQNLLAEKYMVSQSLIGAIVNYKLWKSI